MQGIDPSLMFDNDGKCYFTTTHIDGIIQAEINPKNLYSSHSTIASFDFMNLIKQ